LAGANSRCGDSPKPLASGGEGSGEGEASLRFAFEDRAPTGGFCRSGIGYGSAALCGKSFGVEARARWAAASPPERRSQELSGGGCKPVDEPSPLSPRLIAGLSSSAKAGPIGCTSGRDALEFGVFDFGAFAGFLGVSGFFAMSGIWDESVR